MPELMESPAEVEVIDSPEVESPEIVESAEPSETIESPETELDGTELSGSKLWNAAKEQIKTLDPKLQRAINKAIHDADRYSKKFPDGVNHIDGQLAAVKQLAEDPNMPIEQVIQQSIQERSYFRDLDEKYTNNPKAFVDTIVNMDDPVSKEAFLHAAPEFINKFSEASPEGYSSLVSRATTNWMDSQGLPTQFALLRTFLPMMDASNPATKQIQDAFEQIYGMTEKLRTFAKAPISPERTAKPTEPQNTGDFAQREMNLNAKEWNLEIQQQGISMVHDEAQKFAGKQKLTSDELKKVVGKVSTEMEAILMAKKDYGDAMRSYLKAGNKAQFHQRLQSERKKLVPSATRRAVEDVLAERPKGTAKPTGNTPTVQPGMKPVQGAPQAQRIAGHPKTLGWTVDLNRTPHSMLLKNQAYVVGKQGMYQWPKK